MRYLAPLAALALLSGAAIACGDDDDDDTDDPTSAATTAASTTTTEATQAPSATPTSGDTGSGDEAVEITVGDNFFAPPEETVAVGTEVTWSFEGQLPHSVVGTFNGEEVESDQLTSGAFSFTFDAAGTFDYICGVHGQSMAGSITVE